MASQFLHDPVPDTEFSEEFIQLMANRMMVSWFKYGDVADAAGKIDFIESLEKRIALYKETGNADWIIDAANFAMIEFMHPGHPDYHLRSTDSDESPGRKVIGGDFDSTSRNTALPAA